MNSTTQNPKIAIIGGGPGGLTLARLLQQQNVNVTLYEREVSANARQQGGTLDLHEGSGQLAIKEAKLWPEVEAVMRREGEAMRILDKAAVVHFDESGGDGNRPEIDRGQLREILLNSLQPKVVKWDHILRKVESREDGKYDLLFDNQEPEKGVDLVIGADGAWSKVRPLVSELKPSYSGVTIIETKFTDVDVNQPAISKLVGQGSCSVLADNKGLVAQRNGDGSVRVYIFLRVSEEYPKTCGINFSDAEDARTKLLKLFEDWDPSLKDLITLSDNSLVLRPLYELPVEHSWKTRPGVTLLGDAAHLMTPNGEGVNLAMADALLLSKEIVSNLGDLATGVANYEKEMFPRSKESAEDSRRMMDIMVAEDAPLRFVELLNSFFTEQPTLHE